ncbi:MAG: hypothetical protein ACRDKF_10865, partial [Actinomycetota bacterium]
SRAATMMAIGGLSCAGIVVAHHFAYLFVSRGGVHQHELLAHTGHGHWPYSVGIAMGLLVAGFVGFGRNLAAGPGPSRARRLSVSGLALKLVVFQSLGFLALEASERTLSGLGPGHLFEEPAVVAGLALQAVVALAGAMLLVAFARIVTIVATRRHPEFTTPTAYFFPLVASMVPVRHEVATGSGTLRGPPSK